MKLTTTSITDGSDLTGKCAIVTGSSSGIGLECARILALRGAHVVMANRSEKRTAESVATLRHSIDTESMGRLEYRECDLSRMQTVHTFIERTAANKEPIDLLILNAGVFGMEFQLTEDGFERTLATNYIGHFLLMHRLVAANLLAPDARIVATQTSGIKNPFSKMDLEMLENPAVNRHRYQRAMSSPNSKVLLALMMTEFTRRIKSTTIPEVAFNSGDPGATLTDNVNQLTGALGVLSRLLGPILFKSAEQGAAVLAWAATSPELSGTSGNCYSHKLKLMKLPAKCTNAESARQEWDATESVLKLKSW